MKISKVVLIAAGMFLLIYEYPIFYKPLETTFRNNTSIIKAKFGEDIRVFNQVYTYCLGNMEEDAKPPNYRLVNNFIGHSATIHSMKFSPNGKWLISGSGDSSLKMWNVATGELLKNFLGHLSPVNEVDWSSDNSLLVSASDDRTVKIWDVQRGRLLTTLQGHTGFVASCKFNLQGTLIVSSSYDETIRVWDTRTGNLIMDTPKQGDAISCVVFNQEGSRIAGGSFNGIIGVWELGSSNLVSSIGASYAPITNIKILPNENWLLTMALDNCIKLWNADNRTLKTYRGHKNENYNVKVDYALNSEGTMRIVSGSEDKKIYIWNLESHAVEQKLAGHGSPVVCVECHRSEEIIASTALYCNTEGHHPIKIWKNN